ncbi:ABC transporter permease [Pseudarthrobacter sp. CCNWLW217]
MTALIVAVLFVPAGMGLWKSFQSSSIYQLETTFSLANYTELLGDPVFWSAVQTSVFIGLMTALVTVVLGYWLAHFMRFTRPASAPVIFSALLVALIGGYLVRIYAWRTLLGDSGVINTALMGLGIVKEPLGGLLFSPFAIFVALGSIYLPYAALLISAGLGGVGADEIEAARDLGASRFRTYRGIVVPMAGRSMFQAFILIFLLSASDYVIPQLVGGPRTQMVGSVIYTALVSGGNAGQGAAIAFLSMLLFGAIIGLVWFAARGIGLIPKAVAG